jgi:hypothetical protein
VSALVDPADRSNDNYSTIVDHPAVFGKSAISPEAWGPVWEDVRDFIDRCVNKGEACYRKDDLLLYRRGPRGRFVEKYQHLELHPPVGHGNRQGAGHVQPDHGDDRGSPGAETARDPA